MPPIHEISKGNVPTRLKRAYPPPKGLFYCGNLPNFENEDIKYVAVIGSRHFTDYGLSVCRKLIQGICNYPIIIVSGLALGIDSIAHEAALDAGLITLAFPGSGLEEKALYPTTKVPLAKRIVEAGGCLISEYEPATLSRPFMFPERNRLMASIADAVLVIECTRKSGTMITARLALDYHKDVFSVPGDIFSPTSEGPHYLIKQGATPITCPRDIVEALGFLWLEQMTSDVEMTTVDKQKLPIAEFDGSQDEIELLEALRIVNTRDELIRTLGKSTHAVQATLSLLEIKGVIKEETGKITRLQ